jgi:simple sugar transport system ATP-binding protein
MQAAPAVHLRGITKRFPGVVANDEISLTFHPGEIHVLLGENGAGKSTLMGILAGMLQPDAGQIEVGGRTVRIASPRESLDLGIGTVFQHVLLVSSLTVIENLMLGGPWWRGQDREAVLARFRELSEVLAVEIDPDAVVGALSLGQQQQVEIMRALWRDEGVLILDEPTSMLTPQGVHELGEVMKRLRDSGVAIIFITHKLKEAYAFGDRISVLRLGRLVGQIPKERLREISEEEATGEVIRLMFGAEAGHDEDAETLVGDAHGRTRAVPVDRSGPPFLVVRDVSTEGELGACPLAHVGFEVWPGEVFGIAGVDGNGQKHLAEVLAGQRKAVSGTLVVAGTDVTHGGVAERRRLGVRYITDERLGEGTVPAQSVATNLIMKEIGQPPFWQHGISHWDLIFEHAREKIARHDIRTPSERTPIGRLSGGNIQKTLLARELSEDTRLVVFNKPTYGLDLHNTRLARERIRAGAGEGLATVVISTELDELMDLCDRVGVMYQGELRGIVENEAGAEERIGLLMTGAEAA